MMKTMLSLVILPSMLASVAPAAASSVPSPTVTSAPLQATGECPDRIVYGDPSHPNTFTFLTDGKERVLHFERVAVSIDPEGLHTFYVPLFGESSTWPTRLNITVRASGDAEEVPVARVGVLGGVPADCVPIVPDVEWHWLPSTVEMLSYEPSGAESGRLTAELRFLTDDESPRGLVARIDTEHVTMLSASAGAAQGTRSQTSGDGVRDTVAVSVAATALFRETAGVLEIRSIVEQGQLRTVALHGVTGGPQALAVAGGSRVTIYDILELSAEGLTYDEYFYTVDVSEPAIEPIFERVAIPPSVDLDNAEWLRRMEIPVVVSLPDLPFIEVGAAAEEDALPGDPRGPALGIDDLPPPGPLDMAPPTASQAFFSYYPAHDLFRPEYTETVSQGEESAFVLRIQDGIRGPEGETGGSEAGPAPDPEAVEEVLSLFYEILEVVDSLMDMDDEVAVVLFEEHVADVFVGRGIILERAFTVEDLELLFERRGGGEIPFFLASYAPEVVHEARLYFVAGSQADRRLQPMDPRVTEVRAILTEIWEAMHLLEGAPDEAAAELLVAEHVTAAFDRRGIVLERSPSVSDLGLTFDEGAVPFFLESYDPEVVQDARELFWGAEFGTIADIYDSFLDEARAYDVDLRLDERGLPLRREFTERNTAFRIEYRGDHAFITAENTAQGADTVTVPVPPGTLDLLQWNDVLSRLPLAVGFERTLTLFDLDVYSGESFGLGADGQGYSHRYIRATPVYVTATVRVTGKETVELDGERVDAYRAEVFFGGRPAHPVMSVLSPELNVKGRDGEPLVYLLHASAPHRVLKVDWRETIVQRAVH